MKDKNEFAKESVVEDYLADLLTESMPDAGFGDADYNETSFESTTFNKELTQKLLDQAIEQSESHSAIAEESDERLASEATEQIMQDINSSLAASEHTNLTVEAQIIQEEHKENQIEVEIETSSVEVSVPVSLQESLDERFHALFFEVAGLTLAVPLIELGGIHEISKVAPIIGKPDWFMGVMLKNETTFNVVDSARWVMPEKYDEEMAENLNYRFLINLGKTEWGLTCEKLVNTVELRKSDVKWRNISGKRPWLAGMVKERMCALINVAELVKMLKLGLSSK